MFFFGIGCWGDVKHDSAAALLPRIVLLDVVLTIAIVVFALRDCLRYCLLLLLRVVIFGSGCPC